MKWRNMQLYVAILEYIIDIIFLDHFTMLECNVKTLVLAGEAVRNCTEFVSVKTAVYTFLNLFLDFLNIHVICVTVSIV